MHVDMAVAMDRSGACPEAQRARAAYRVLAAAANNAGHYAVLGVAAPPGDRPTRESHDAVKAQHKALCDAFETAGKSSAAVAAALKLVKQAFSALTDIRKNEGAVPVPRAAPVRVVVVSEQKAPVSDYPPAVAVFVDEPVAPEQKGHDDGTAAADEQEKEEEDYYAGGGRRR